MQSKENQEIDFNKIDTTVLERHYFDLAAMVSMSGFDWPFMEIDRKIIKEEAEGTMSIYNTKHLIERKFSLQQWQVGNRKDNDGNIIMVIIPDMEDNFTVMKDAMSACGWQLSSRDFFYRDRMTWNILSFRPIFQDNKSQEVWKSRFLYHWAPKYRYDNIQRQGLYPNGENLLFDYPYTLHLLKSTLNKAKIMNYGRILCDANENPNNDGTYILFAVDLHKLPDDFEIYYDPKFEDGYYCKEPIPIQAIKPINTCNFKK